METLMHWIAANVVELRVSGLLVSLFGIVLFLAGRLNKSDIGVRQKADRGGVIVNGDNRGIINTGQIGASDKAPDRLEKLAAWATILGLPIAILGLIVAVLAWRFPISPT